MPTRADPGLDHLVWAALADAAMDEGPLQPPGLPSAPLPSGPATPGPLKSPAGAPPAPAMPSHAPPFAADTGATDALLEQLIRLEPPGIAPPPMEAQPPRPPSADADSLYGASTGNKQPIEALGRVFVRRDPAAADDPLPMGRDAVTYSTGAMSSGNDPAQHAPDLIAYRASDDFPRADGAEPAADGTPGTLGYVPEWLANRAPNAPAIALWPAAPPTARGVHSRSNRPEAPRPGGDRSGNRAPAAPDLPPWLQVAALPAAAPPSVAHSAPSTPAAPAHTDRAPTGHAAADLGTARADFPILSQTVNGKRLVWLDNGATTQKPRQVIRAISNFYERDNSNVHRGAHTLAMRATDAYEAARSRVKAYLGGGPDSEVVFVRGSTEAINLVAEAWGPANIGPGDEIIVSHLEHHANIVPWQHLAQKRGALLRVIPVTDSGEVRLDAYEAMLSAKVKLVAVTHIANTIGTIVPVGPIAAMAKAHGARVLVDGAQSVAHMPLDLSCLPIDFFVFSGHKVYAPTGIGALWAKKDVLDAMAPWQRGGSMIRDVTFERTIYADPPARFEAGTPSLADAVGLHAALDYVDAIGRPRIAAWEHSLMDEMLAGLATIKGMQILGNPMLRAGSVCFVVDGHAPGDVAKHLDRHGIAVRAGHHCAQPILRRFGYEQTLRASLGLYNTSEDIDRLVTALRDLR